MCIYIYIHTRVYIYIQIRILYIYTYIMSIFIFIYIYICTVSFLYWTYAQELSPVLVANWSRWRRLRTAAPSTSSVRSPRGGGPHRPGQATNGCRSEQRWKNMFDFANGGLFNGNKIRNNISSAKSGIYIWDAVTHILGFTTWFPSYEHTFIWSFSRQPCLITRGQILVTVDMIS